MPDTPLFKPLRPLHGFVPGCALFVFLFGAPALADWVTLRDGRRETCVVLEENPHYIRVMRAGGELTLSRDNVASVERSPAGENTLLQAEYALNGGDSLLEAIPLLERARSSGASGANVAIAVTPALRDLQKSEKPLANEQASRLKKFLETFAGPESNGAPNEFLYLAALLLGRNGSMDLAVQFYQRIPADRPVLSESQRAAFCDIVVADLQHLLDGGDMDQAVSRLETLSNLDPKRARSCAAPIDLNAAGRLRKEGKFAEALQIYETRIAPDFPELAKDRAIVALEEAVEQANDDKSFHAAEALLDGPAEKFPGAEILRPLRGKLLGAWGDALMEEKDYDGARKVYLRYAQAEPGKGSLSLKRVYYYEKLGKLDPDAPDERNQLAQFCLESGLLDEAAQEFRKLHEDPDWRELADLQLKLLEKQRYEGMLFDALALKDAGKFGQAREKTAFVLSHVSDPELLENARTLADRINKAMEEETTKAPVQAEILYQNAERCVLPQQSEECLAYLDRIVREYPETPAAQKARDYRRKIISRGLAQLERPGKPVPEEPASRSLKPSSPDSPEFVQQDRLLEETRRIQKALETPKAK